MPKISVIVPIYNVEKYLRRCIVSILNQTFTDFELILVDDGSTDSSSAICDEYAVNNGGNVVVVHQKNGGVSSARNIGVSVATGDYIAFVDSDDYVSQNYLEALFNPSYDMSICRGGIIDSNGNVINNSRQKCVDTVQYVNNDNICKWFFDDGFLNSSCMCLYRRDIIKKNNLLFDKNTKRGEDAIFAIEYVSCCKTVKFINDILYFYVRYGEGTLSTTLNEFNIKSIDYFDSYLNDWFGTRNIICEKLLSPDYWTKKELKYQFSLVLASANLSYKEKYRLYKLFYNTNIFKYQRYYLFKNDNWKFRFFVSFPSPVFILIYDMINRTLEKIK